MVHSWCNVCLRKEIYMAKAKTTGGSSTKGGKISFSDNNKGGTTIGLGKIKFGTMNKNKRRSFKKYRGQGRP